MSGALQADLPAPTTPIVDPQTGLIDQTWWYFFQRLFARTGSGTGGAFGNPGVITLGASPFTYTATVNGNAIVSGGGVARLEIARGNGTFYLTGSNYGAFPLAVGDKLRMTYIGAPQLVFFPG